MFNKDDKLLCPSSFPNPCHILLKMIPLDSFMAHSADGRLVPVVPGGQNISLTFANRTEYVERALDYRLHEMDSQVCRVELLENDLGVFSRPVQL